MATKMKLTLALALLSVVRVHGAAGDCTPADYVLGAGLQTCTLAVPKTATAAAVAFGPCTGCTSWAASVKDAPAQIACIVEIPGKMSAKCKICAPFDATGAAPLFPACLPAQATTSCNTADVTTYGVAAACTGTVAVKAACEAAAQKKLRPACSACLAAGGATKNLCFNYPTLSKELCCKAGAGLDALTTVGMSATCVASIGNMVTPAMKAAYTSAACPADMTAAGAPAAIKTTCKVWFNTLVMGAGKKCVAPSALKASAPTSSSVSSAAVALVLVALRLH